jgi:parallel beta-helix repeat protein
VNDCDNVTVTGASIHGLKGDGVVVTGSTAVVIRDNHIGGMGGASVVLHRGTTSTVVERNEIVRNLGSSNMAAAVLVTDRDVDISEKAENVMARDGYWPVSQPLTQRLKPPRNNVIALNHLAWNAASGIYVDGGAATVIAMNLIEGNAKEGICLDNGATANVITANEIVQNGNRWGESDAVMEKESIARGGRLPNGTPASKVPGISIDNAVYNIVFSNTISHNFGGGIKIVRTGYFNSIGLNTIFANNDGASEAFHFFGVELGAAPLDAPSVELDASPSRGNIVFSNAIRGSHYAGIFFAAGSDLNDAFDNIIMDTTNWALESVEPQANSSLNNLTNLPSRNIGSGLSPALLDPAKKPDTGKKSK